jgi:hypothetical protein
MHPIFEFMFYPFEKVVVFMNLCADTEGIESHLWGIAATALSVHLIFFYRWLIGAYTIRDGRPKPHFIDCLIAPIFLGPGGYLAFYMIFMYPPWKDIQIFTDMRSDCESAEYPK